MPVPTSKNLADYLSKLHGRKVHLTRTGKIGRTAGRGRSAILKGFGYGSPYLIKYEAGAAGHEAVLSTMRPGPFGHEFVADRAQALILCHASFNQLPNHARCIDLGYIDKNGKLNSIGGIDEPFILVEKIEGNEYYKDLNAIAERRALSDLDRKRCRVLSDYLVTIHSVKRNDSTLYERRIRELIGHGECIMGLVDSYPLNVDFVDMDKLKAIEKRCLDWRWKIKSKKHRLSQIHGDFHPWNIVFGKGTDFRVLDRSRGPWGEPADDIAALTINYIFFSLRSTGELREPFDSLLTSFMEGYLDGTGDDELMTVIQPFYAWRALVVASPVWYPDLPQTVRSKLFNFIFSVLETERFDFKQVRSYVS